MNQYYTEMTAPANWEADYNEQTIYSSEMSEINSNDSYSIVGDSQYDLELTPIDTRVPRVQSGKITKNYNQVPAASRPGRKPRQADEELSQQDLERRNRRRARNREAATRQRDRRIFQVQNLESRVEQLRTTKIQLSQENEQLRNQVEEAKRQFYDMTGYQYTNPNEQNSNSNSEILSSMLTAKQRLKMACLQKQELNLLTIPRVS